MINVCSVIGSYAGVLPHMLEHYRELGVDRILLVHTHVSRVEPQTFSRARPSIAQRYDAEVVIDYVGPWHEKNQCSITL